MIFNGDADKQDIVSLCDDWANTNVITYPLQEKTRSANKAMRRFWSLIFRAYGGWQYDDSNNTTNLPESTTTLYTGQIDYGIPPTALTIKSVGVLIVGSNLYKKLSPITKEAINSLGLTESNLTSSTGVPVYYMPYGNSIKLYPAPSYTLAAGLKIAYDRGSTSFASTDTTKQPGFDGEFHEGVPLSMALDFAGRSNIPTAELKEQLFKIEDAMVKHYAAKYQELFPPRVTVRDPLQEYI